MRAGFRFSFMRQLGCDVESGVAIEAEPEEAVEGNDHTYGMAILFSAYDEHYTYVSLGENPPRGIFSKHPRLTFHFDFTRFSVFWRDLVECFCLKKVLSCASTFFIVKNRGRGYVEYILWGGNEGDEPCNR